MAARNDITGAAIQTKVASKAYRDNWDAIFNKKKVDNAEISEQTPKYMCNMHGSHAVKRPEDDNNEFDSGANL